MKLIDKMLHSLERRHRLVHARIEQAGDSPQYRAICLVWDGGRGWETFESEHDDAPAAERWIEGIRQQYPDGNMTAVFNLIPAPDRSIEALEAM